MSETIKVNGHRAVEPATPERLGELADRLTECVDELDALGKFCEANHVALARDLVLRGNGPDSATDPEQLA